MNAQTPADELRTAATRMRERANAATPSADPQPGGWAGFGTDADGDLGRSMIFGGPAENGYRLGTVFSTEGRCDECVGASDADVQHIAGWHPAVALVVADWLESVADRIDRTLPRSAVLGEEPTRPAERNHAFTVARAYLGTTEQVTA